MKNKSMVFEIIKKELREVLRDKKTLFMMLILPLVLYPCMFVFFFSMGEETMNADITEYNKIGFSFDIDDTLNTLVEEVEIQKEIGTEEELKIKLEEGKINAYITLNDKEFTIYYTAQDTTGMNASLLCNELLETYKKAIQSHMITSEGLVPDEIFNVYTIEEKDISGKDYFSEMMLGMLPSMMLMTTSLTAVLVAIDMTAGEKERGTLETLLTFPIKSGDIITGKFLATTICTTISSIISFASLYGVIYYFSKTSESFSGVELLSVQNIVLAMIAFILFSMLVSALAIVIASSTKSFKEAQNATQPLQLAAMVPMFMSMMGTKLDVTLSLIPFINIAFVLNDIISNTVNMQYFIITVISNLVFIYISLKAIVKLYKSDKILFS